MSRPTQVSMQDIAKAAGVSPQTVSRVANGSDAVKPETRQRVEAAMERLGYRPNYAARALKHGRFQDIGVVMFNTATFGNARILDSIVANAADDDYSVTIQTMRHGAERTLSAAIDRMQRQPVDVSKIVMAIKCGASDTTSGMASNCVIGYVADKLVDLGATVIFGETTEFLGGEHLLARRAVNKEVADKIYEIVTNMENRAKSIGCDMRKGQPTPGNIAGGLSSIEEKSLGAIVKSGTRPIQGVLEYPQHASVPQS